MFNLVKLIKKLSEANVDEITLVNLLYPIIVTTIGIIISNIVTNRKEKNQAKIAAIIINNDIKKTKKELKELYIKIIENFKATLLYTNFKENTEKLLSSEDFKLVIESINSSLEKYDFSYIDENELSSEFLEKYCKFCSGSYRSLFKNSYFNLNDYVSLYEQLYLISGYCNEEDIIKLIKFDNDRKALIYKIENILQNIKYSYGKPIVHNIVNIKDLLENSLVFLKENEELDINI